MRPRCTPAARRSPASRPDAVRRVTGAAVWPPPSLLSRVGEEGRMGENPARSAACPRSRGSRSRSKQGRRGEARPGQGFRGEGGLGEVHCGPPREREGRSPSPGRAAAARSGWLSGIRFSGFSLIMMGVLVLAVVVLAPTIAAFAQQRQQIAELRAAVSAAGGRGAAPARRARTLERRDVHHDPGARAAVLRDAGRGELPRHRRPDRGGEGGCHRRGLGRSDRIEGRLDAHPARLRDDRGTRARGDGARPRPAGAPARRGSANDAARRSSP